MSEQKVQQVIWNTIEFMERAANTDRMSVDLGGDDMVFFRGESHIIKLIGDQPGIINSEVARKLGVQRTVVFRTIKNLEGRNIIEKRTSEINKKQLCLSLTEKGRDVYERLVEYQQKKNEIFFSYLSELSDSELDTVLRYIECTMQTFDRLSES